MMFKLTVTYHEVGYAKGKNIPFFLSVKKSKLYFTIRGHSLWKPGFSIK